MKRPVSPPPLDELLEKYKERLPAVLTRRAQPTVDGHYIHWDTLRRKTSRPVGLSTGEWWTDIRLARFGQSRLLPLRDTRGRPFTYLLPDRVQEALHRIDSRASGRIGATETVTNPATRDRFIVNSLIREATASSQLEGASTTRAVAAKMIRAGRRPRNRSEWDDPEQLSGNAGRPGDEGPAVDRRGSAGPASRSYRTDARRSGRRGPAATPRRRPRRGLRRQRERASPTAPGGTVAGTAGRDGPVRQR